MQQPQSLPSQQQQQQQTNGTASALSSLHAQTSNSGPAPSVASTSDVGLDPNDFPALGSTPANANSSNSNNTSGAGATSYATQAGTGVLLGGTGGGSMGTSAAGGIQTRDFNPDDFPALGGQTQTTQQTRDPSNHSSTTPDLSHPPGLNGFQPSEQQQLRQNILGHQSSGLQQVTPGMLNLGPTQPRNIHPGFQQAPTDAEKQQQRVRLFMPYFSQKSTSCNRISFHVSVQGIEELIPLYLRTTMR
jgi:CCR4-NOT transcription complex subunit 2